MLVFFLIAVAAGLTMPVQSRANGALGQYLKDPIAAATVSFGSGLLLLVLVLILVPGPRAAARSIVPVLRNRTIPRYYVLAGLIGAFVVVAQSASVPFIGIALFTVGVVGAQSVSGLLVDHWGLAPGGRRRITPARVIGVVLMIAAVALSVSGRLNAGPGVAWWMALPLAAGFLMSFQQAANGHSARAYGSPLAATAVNFLAGFLGLTALWALLHLGQGFPRLGGEWWMYLGGLCGCVFIAVNAWLLRHLGVLATVIGTVAGQLLGSLVLDLVLPAPGSRVGPETVAGLLLTFAAMGIMNIRARNR
ncbi:DMT family transporter [Falsarthrobacter nasiphocae]|uniref:Transporter family-2 protein n=1 Tax=Falsarthrobacter nasiphocae TaxID=189863 RepID=A0AAE3YHY3_9MICC|nr:DMT family transporter [Falsarthrobacter nasiphocae]MDR6892617.1 transporter family-2 protein [Falsarthrobacter nasiphocae]